MLLLMVRSMMVNLATYYSCKKLQHSLVVLVHNFKWYVLVGTQFYCTRSEIQCPQATRFLGYYTRGSDRQD